MSTPKPEAKQELFSPAAPGGEVVPFPLKVFCTTTTQPRADTGDPAEATLLTTRAGLPLTKHWSVGEDGTPECAGYGRAKWVVPEAAPFGTLPDIMAVLRTVRPDQCVVRGEVIDDIHLDENLQRARLEDGASSEYVLRRIHGAPNGPACFKPCARIWMMADFDGVPAPDGLDLTDRAAVGRYLASLLPEPFTIAGFVLQFSAGHLGPGNEGVIKAHLFFVLSQPVTDEELAAWLHDAPVDPNVFRAVQPHYIAAPIFDDGVPDPCPERIYLEPGIQDVVEVPDDLPTVEPPRQASVRTGSEPRHGWDHPGALKQWDHYRKTFPGVSENELYNARGKAGRHNRVKELVGHGWDLAISSERVREDAYDWDARENHPPIGHADIDHCVDYHYGVNGKASNAQNDPGCAFRTAAEVFAEQIEQKATKAPAGIFNGARSISALDVAPRQVRFVWRPYIVAECINIIGGRGGSGKGLVAAHAAAAITTGGKWPCGLPAPKGNVLWCETEDPLDSVMVPRLQAAGADLSRIQFVNPKDFSLDGFTALVREFKPVLIVMSPLVSFMRGLSDIRDEMAVRGALEQLQATLEETGASLLGIGHLNKKPDLSAVERLLGSVAFVNFVRSVLLVAPEQDAEDVSRLAHSKHNNSVKGSDWCYQPVPDGPYEQSLRLKWSRPERNIEPDTMFDKRKPDDSSAAGWLVAHLTENGETERRQLLKDAEEAGYTKHAIEKAKQRSRRIITRQTPTFPAVAMWRLAGRPTLDQGDQP